MSFVIVRFSLFFSLLRVHFALASQQPAWLGEASSDGEVGLRQVQSMRLGDAKRLPTRLQCDAPSQLLGIEANL